MLRMRHVATVWSKHTHIHTCAHARGNRLKSELEATFTTRSKEKGPVSKAKWLQTAQNCRRSRHARVTAVCKRAEEI